MSTAVLRTANQALSQRTRHSVLFGSQSASGDWSRISLTAGEVSQGWKYQWGVPRIGWSPEERRGNWALPVSFGWTTESVMSRPESRSVRRLKRSVVMTCARVAGLPPTMKRRLVHVCRRVGFDTYWSRRPGSSMPGPCMLDARRCFHGGTIRRC